MKFSFGCYGGRSARPAGAAFLQAWRVPACLVLSALAHAAPAVAQVQVQDPTGALAEALVRTMQGELALVEGFSADILMMLQETTDPAMAARAPAFRACVYAQIASPSAAYLGRVLRGYMSGEELRSALHFYSSATGQRLVTRQVAEGMQVAKLSPVPPSTPPAEGDQEKIAEFFATPVHAKLMLLNSKVFGDRPAFHAMFLPLRETVEDCGRKTLEPQ